MSTKRGRPTLLEERIDAIVAAYVSGKSSYEVAGEFGCTPMTVLKWVRKRVGESAIRSSVSYRKTQRVTK